MRGAAPHPARGLVPLTPYWREYILLPLLCTRRGRFMPHGSFQYFEKKRCCICQCNISLYLHVIRLL